MDGDMHDFAFAPLRGYPSVEDRLGQFQWPISEGSAVPTWPLAALMPRSGVPSTLA